MNLVQFETRCLGVVHGLKLESWFDIQWLEVLSMFQKAYNRFVWSHRLDTGVDNFIKVSIKFKA